MRDTIGVVEVDAVDPYWRYGFTGGIIHPWTGQTLSGTAEGRSADHRVTTGAVR